LLIEKKNAAAAAFLTGCLKSVFYTCVYVSLLSAPQGKQLTASPTAGLSTGEIYTLKRIIIPETRVHLRFQ
jgi:hypothetical protein